MKQWLVSLAGTEADLAQLVGRRDSDEWRIDRDQRHGVVLSAHRFEGENSYEAVGQIADALISRINVSARYYVVHFQGVKRHTTIKRQNGQEHMSVQLGQAVEVNVAASVSWVKYAADGRILETSQDRIEEDRGGSIPPLVALQERCPDLGAALRYLQDEPDMYGLYKAAEAIARPLNGKRKWDALVSLGWTSQSKLDRFKSSAQTMRHHEEKGPANPMSLSEADSYVRDLLGKLIDHLESLP